MIRCAGGAALTYGAAVQVGLVLKAPGTSIAYFWPAAGVGAVLVVLALRRAWSLAAASVAGLVLANVMLNALAGQPAGMVAGFTAANCLESGVVAAVFVWGRRRCPSPTMGMPALLVSAAAGVAASTAVAMALLVPVTSDPVLKVAVNWAVPDLAGVVVVASLLLVPHRVPRGRWGEAGAQIAVLTTVCAVVNVSTRGLPIAWAPLPVLVWSATRLGTTWTAVGSCLVAAASSWAAAQGRGPFGGGTEWGLLLAGQAFAAVAVFTAMSLAIVAMDREQIARTLSQHDPLTGLANRRRLAESLPGLITSGRPDAVAAVLYCDLDGFKTINDEHGHRVGDQILQSVAARLARVVRPRDIVARVGGDEFAIVCVGLPNRGEAGRIRDRILDMFEVPIVVGDRAHSVGISIGLALADRDSSLEELLHQADTSMFRHKAEQRRHRMPVPGDGS